MCTKERLSFDRYEMRIEKVWNVNWKYKKWSKRRVKWGEMKGSYCTEYSHYISADRGGFCTQDIKHFYDVVAVIWWLIKWRPRCFLRVRQRVRLFFLSIITFHRHYVFRNTWPSDFLGVCYCFAPESLFWYGSQLHRIHF